MIEEFQGKYRFLSNFYPCKIFQEIKIPEEQVTYHFNWESAEHYYQSLKTNDIEEKTNIFLLSTPGKAKRYGSNLTLIPDWENRKLGIMKIVVTEKFKQTKDLRDLLLDTTGNVLIEGNYWHDNYWGICYCNRCVDLHNRFLLDCHNFLGKILMDIRHQYLMEII
jgi:ribA/ribD-fused uncharacterized protein